MSKDIAIIVLGISVALLPFLGFPGAWETVLLVFFGLGIVTLAFLWRRDILLSLGGNGKKTEVYTENGVNGDGASQQTPTTDRPKV